MYDHFDFRYMTTSCISKLNMIDFSQKIPPFCQLNCQILIIVGVKSKLSEIWAPNYVLKILFILPKNLIFPILTKKNILTHFKNNKNSISNLSGQGFQTNFLQFNIPIITFYKTIYSAKKRVKKCIYLLSLMNHTGTKIYVCLDCCFLFGQFCNTFSIKNEFIEFYLFFNLGKRFIEIHLLKLFFRLFFRWKLN